MRLIWIRHGEPNYEIDGLTQDGKREASLLADRAAKWDMTDIFCSPLGRAQETASYTLKKTGRIAKTYDWMKEFKCGLFDSPDGSKDKSDVPWDFYPDYWTADPRLGERDHWTETPVMAAQPEGIKTRFKEVTDGIDFILAQYGYIREKGYYRISKDANRDATLVFFCHLGLAGAACSWLLNIAPPVLWQSFFMAPSAITVLNTEERQGDIAGFRCQVMGDTSHLRAVGEHVSQMGAFSDIFQG